VVSLKPWRPRGGPQGVGGPWVGKSFDESSNPGHAREDGGGGDRGRGSVKPCTMIPQTQVPFYLPTYNNFTNLYIYKRAYWGISSTLSFPGERLFSPLTVSPPASR